jgi:hypothetical protein
MKLIGAETQRQNKGKKERGKGRAIKKQSEKSLRNLEQIT